MPASFWRSPFEVKREIPASALRDRNALLVNGPRSFLCVPVWLFNSGLGAIYLDSGRLNAFTVQHLNLLIAITGQVAAPLDYTRHIDSLQFENRQLLESQQIVVDWRSFCATPPGPCRGGHRGPQGIDTL